MSHDIFDSHEEMIEVIEVNQEHILLYMPVAKASDDTQHAWKASLKVDLSKEMAVAAGLPEEVFSLDHFHYEEYSGKKLSELLSLVKHEKKPKVKFDIRF